MCTQRSLAIDNLATSVYKVNQINRTVSSALPSIITSGINFASGGLTLPVMTLTTKVYYVKHQRRHKHRAMNSVTVTL